MRKGFTLIELLAVIVILAVIALIATPIILGIISDSKQQAFKDAAYGIVNAAKYNYVEIMYSGETPTNVTFTYQNGVETSSVEGYTLNYEGDKPQNGQVGLTSEGKVAIVLHDGKYCVTKGYNDVEVTITEKNWTDCEQEIATIVVIATDYNEEKGVNNPKLITGMTPIKWVGGVETTTTSNDSNWFDYNTGNWANAKTADGSYWVWVPRYIYKISSGWHTKTAGTINIQFSKAINDNWNSDVIGAIDTGTTSSASNNTWTNHPAFTFGTKEVTGIWVAKFEASVANQSDLCYTTESAANCNKTTLISKIIPDAKSWRYISVGNSFTITRNMETNNTYGWGTSGDGLDTHLMKNVEWGAVAYLSKSTYGKNAEEIYINNSATYITGCAGNTASEANYSGCQNVYNTANGLKASSTGTIYGVYDLSGGNAEWTAAYVSNGSSYLATYGSSIVNAEAKYKDIYTKAATDSRDNNYLLTNSKKGDAVWETSGDTIGDAWFGDHSMMPYVDVPWFTRGDDSYDSAYTGAFSFYCMNGNVLNGNGFRPVLIVATGV